VEVGVLIAGAGPVGLSLACELERHGVGHRIVDAAPARAAVSRATDLLRQSDLEDLLCGHLTATVERGKPVELVRQDEEGVVARVESEEVRAAFLVACDGVHSGLREVEEDGNLSRPVRPAPIRRCARTVGWVRSQTPPTSCARTGTSASAASRRMAPVWRSI
jgi:2-polyprenyl-6-methoxyphenol hydroxylase-like FAD-dependent oxidoreductase